MDLKELRSQIDDIDDQLVKLFAQRMDIAAGIAEYKRQQNMPIFVPAREREKLLDVAQKAGPEMANYTRVLYSMLFELSRSYQSKLGNTVSPLYQPARAWRVLTPRSPVKRSSKIPSSCTSRISTAYSPPSKRVCANMASFPSKTPLPAR